MDLAVQLDDQLQPGTVEVNDEDADRGLPAELDPRQSAIPQDLPHLPFRRCRRRPKDLSAGLHRPDRYRTPPHFPLHTPYFYRNPYRMGNTVPLRSPSPRSGEGARG